MVVSIILNVGMNKNYIAIIIIINIVILHCEEEKNQN